MPGGETEKEVSAWTVDSLHEHIQKQLNDLRATLLERYETQAKAIEVAFAQQQTAMSTALASAEKAVDKALASAEKAVDKAESASEKRFESVNEFRGQQADIIRNFPSKIEVDVRFTALDEKITLMYDRLDAQISPIMRYMNREQGKSAGMGQAWIVLVGAVGAAAAVIAIILAFRPV